MHIFETLVELMNIFSKFVSSYFLYNQGKKDEELASDRTYIENVKEAQEIKSTIDDLSDADLDNFLRSKTETPPNTN